MTAEMMSAPARRVTAVILSFIFLSIFFPSVSYAVTLQEAQQSCFDALSAKRGFPSDCGHNSDSRFWGYYCAQTQRVGYPADPESCGGTANSDICAGLGSPSVIVLNCSVQKYFYDPPPAACNNPSGTTVTLAMSLTGSNCVEGCQSTCVDNGATSTCTSSGSVCSTGGGDEGGGDEGGGDVGGGDEGGGDEGGGDGGGGGCVGDNTTDDCAHTPGVDCVTVFDISCYPPETFPDGDGDGDGQPDDETKSATPSNSCEAPPNTTNGDPQLSAILMQLWYQQCYGEEVKPDKLRSDLASDTSVKDSNSYENSSLLVSDSSGEISGAVNNALSLIADNGSGSGYCPFSNFTVHVLTVSVVVPLSDYCPLIPMLRTCVIMMAFMWAGTILMRSIVDQ